MAIACLAVEIVVVLVVHFRGVEPAGLRDLGDDQLNELNELTRKVQDTLSSREKLLKA